MQLLYLSNNGEYSLVERIGNDIPPYAILSHTWGKDDDEVTFQDILNGKGKDKLGYRKVRFCVKQAAKDGLQFSWIDTCCIDKTSSAQLSEAINSMFRWYKGAERCYVFLSDVSNTTSDRDDDFSRRWKPEFKKSRWFTRGWTLQELIAPALVEFFSEKEERLGDKHSLEKTLHDITGIAIDALRGSSLTRFSVNERMSWAANRQTKREEDEAYCLLGIFDVQMPLLYGEGREKALRRLQKETRETLKDNVLSLNDEQKQTLLESLRFAQIDTRQMTIKNANTKTCKWLLAKPEYIDWLDATKLGEHHGFLWIKGKPGTGKSTLMKFALANARKTMKDKTVISFFFNARGESIEKSTIGTYRSLLLQLLERLPALQCAFDSLGLSSPNVRSDHRWNIEELKMLLEDAIISLGGSSVVCFIDALDECKEEQVRDMIQFFERIGELAMLSRIQFRVCFSSRHYPHIAIKNGLDLVLEGQEGHTQDITNYVESQLNIGKSNIAQQVRSELQEKASGIFMWVVLVVGILNREHDRGRVHALRRRLREIPGDLYELFRDILTRDSNDRDELVLCIQWVLFAREPLSPEQLYFAILSGVEPDGVSTWDPGNISRDVMKRFILDSSKGLTEVTISKLEKVQFIHESVRDFLLKEDSLSNIWSDIQGNLQGQSHERLKQCCLNYMKVDALAALEISESLPKASTPQAVAMRKAVNDSFPFLKYAINETFYHANEAEAGGVSQTYFLDSFPLSRWVQLDNLFTKHKVRRHSAGVSLLYLLAEHDMAELIGAHPRHDSGLVVENERYGCPVFAAMATRSQQALKKLLERMAVHPVEDQHLEEDNQSYYEEYTHTDIRRDFTFSKRRTVISYAAEFGYKRIVSSILESDKVDINSTEPYGQTLLLLAARNGHEAVVKLLLEIGNVDINSTDPYGQTPLLLAAMDGHEAVVKLLLEIGNVDVESEDLYGQTPLLLAAMNGHEAVVKLLLEIGNVDINSTDPYGQTPLLLAARNGHEAVVKLLLDIGKVDVEIKDKYGQTPLLLAARNRHEAVVRLLLNTGKVNVNSKDWSGQTPLSLAVQNGHAEVVELLQSSMGNWE